MNFLRLLIVAITLSSCGNLPSCGELDVVGPDTLPKAGNQISVTTWNVGYGTMGASADFIADGGEHLRALDAREVAKAVRDIGARAGTGATHAFELPQEPGYFFLKIKRYYAAVVTEVPIHGTDQKWVLMNIHLSAFDDGANVRQAQVQAVLDFAKNEYAKGNYVVLGGDWNMRISDKEFAHTTSDENLFWIYDFPEGLLPNGWRFGVDKRTPTVRTLHKPYVEGENSDHHPVTAEFSIR
ncbi:hypothetical protein A9Q96_10810 [Rhodobacterales bacterium 52_120_T64]|nr:hypothetical protein A9Q96_10810 [Rhodobacterales bacterium 52_120_T64]